MARLWISGIACAVAIAFSVIGCAEDEPIIGGRSATPKETSGPPEASPGSSQPTPTPTPTVQPTPTPTPTPTPSPLPPLVPEQNPTPDFTPSPEPSHDFDLVDPDASP